MREHIERLEKALAKWRGTVATGNQYHLGRQADAELLGVLKSFDERLTAIENGQSSERAA